jgi:DNA-binding PadR family transcriptional regulator
MQDMHGYQIADVIDTHFGDAAHMPKATMYDTLRKLADEGLVSTREEQEGNRPTRTVYSMTDSGEAEFIELLRESVTSYEEVYAFDGVGLMFIDTLPKKEVVELLESRRERLVAIAAGHSPTSDHGGVMSLAAERISRRLDGEIAWLDDALVRLR